MYSPNSIRLRAFINYHLLNQKSLDFVQRQPNLITNQRLFNAAILPAIFHLLARPVAADAAFAACCDCRVKLMAATMAAATRASSLPSCVAAFAFCRSRNLAM